MAKSLFEEFHPWGFAIRPTSPRSPWQNGYTERLIGSIRRECLDYLLLEKNAPYRKRFREQGVFFAFQS